MPLFEMSTEEAHQLHESLQFTLNDLYEARQQPAVMKALGVDDVKYRMIRDRLFKLQDRLVEFCHENGHY